MTPADWIAAAICAASVLVSAASSLSASATSPDLLLFWGSKAQAFASARTIDDVFLGEPFLRFLHTSYPPLVTNAYAFATIVAGRLSWMAAVATFPLLLAALAVALPAVLRTSVSRRDALGATAFITASFALAGHALDMAGNADMALLFFEILAVALLLAPKEDDAPAELMAGLLFAGAAAAKVEGLPFVIAAGGLLMLRRRPPRRLARTAALTLLPSVLSLGVWFAYGRRYFLFSGYESYGPTFDVHLSRVGIVLGEILRSFWSTGAALPWLLPIVALAVTARRHLRLARLSARDRRRPLALLRLHVPARSARSDALDHVVRRSHLRSSSRRFSSSRSPRQASRGGERTWIAAEAAPRRATPD